MYPSCSAGNTFTWGVATSAMLKAGASSGATGENAVLVACRSAGVIVGPVGIVIADALGGEVTPAMATAVAQSPAKRVRRMTSLPAEIFGIPERGLIRRGYVADLVVFDAGNP